MEVFILTFKEKIPTKDLLAPVRSLIDSGKDEEAFKTLGLFYVYVIGEVYNNHFSIQSTIPNHKLEMTKEDEENIKNHYNKIANTTNPIRKRYHLQNLGKLLSEITKDSFFIESLQVQKKQTIGVASSLSLPKSNFHNTKFSSKLRPEAFPNEYTTGDAATILGVSKETIRRMCDTGRFPDAHKTNGKHWRIPSKYFKISPEEALNAKEFMAPLDEKTKKQLGESVDDIDIIIDKS